MDTGGGVGHNARMKAKVYVETRVISYLNAEELMET